MSRSGRLAVAAAVAATAFIPGPALAAGPASHAASRAAVLGSSTDLGTAIQAQHFSSPSSASRHTVVAPRRADSVAAALPRTASGSTIYAKTAGNCSNETGNGSEATPFCKLQDAVNAAAPGDTIVIFGGGPTDYLLTITKSDLTIVGEPVDGLIPAITGVTGPMLTLDGVHDVAISNLEVLGSVAIENSTAVTFDSSYVEGIRNSTNNGPMPAVTIDGSSSGITISRTMLVDVNLAEEKGIAVSSGASNVTVAGDAFRASGLNATGVNGLNVVGSTFQRGCSGAVNVSASTGVSIENNVFEDADATTNAINGGYPSSCNPWYPDVVVSGTAGSATADYNDFLLPAADKTYPYAWFGTDYATVGAFQTATGQGAHDTTDPTAFTTVDIDSGSNNSGLIELAPPADSPAVGSANPAAPGQLPSDFFGVSPYTSRGAMQYAATNPGLAVALSGESDLARGMTVGYTIATKPGRALTVTVDWGDGAVSSFPVTATGATTVTGTAQHEYAAFGRYTVKVTVSDDTSGDQAVNTMTVSTAGSEYTAYGPVRLLDTRNGTGGVSKPLTSSAPIRLKVAGNGTIPTDVTAVAMNVTVTNVTSGGNVAVNPDGATPSGTSNLNFSPGQTVANMVIVPVGADGYVSFTKQGVGSAAVIADVAGYYTQTAASGYTTSSPTRILDTRNGTGGVSGPLTSTTPIKLKIAGNGPIPANVTAVAVNLTLTNSSGGGNVVAYPDGTTQPTASNLNYAAGQTVANAAIVPVTDGYIDLAKQGSGSVAMIVDVEGYFSPDGASAYLPVSPTRLFDSRKVQNGKLPGGFAEGLGIDQDSNGNVLLGVTALVLNSTVTNVTGGGYLTVFPDNTNGINGEPLVPDASNLNFGAGATVPNLTFATPGSNGVVDFYNGARTGSLDLIVDIFGYYANN